MKKNIVFLFSVLCSLTILGLSGSNAAVVFENTWGTSGTNPGQFSYPESVAVDSQSNVYVADTQNWRIEKFNSNGSTLLTTFGVFGGSYFNTAKAVALDSYKNIYILEDNNSKVQKFSTACTYITSWGMSTSGTTITNFTYPYGLAVFSTSAKSTTTTGTTILITVDKEIVTANVYVADTQNYCIEKFNTSTTITTTTRVTVSSGGTAVTITTADTGGTFVTYWGKLGSINGGEFDYPWGVAVDKTGNVYVSDYNNNCIQKFTSAGAFITKWGSLGTGNGQLHHPRGLAVDSSGNVIYVADSYNNRIQKFDTNGTFLTTWGSLGTGSGQFAFPCGVTVSTAGKIYVADTNNHRIQQFYEVADIPPIPPVTAGPSALTIVGGVNGYVNPAKGESCKIEYLAGLAGDVKISIFSSSGVLVRTITGITSDGSTTSTVIYDCKDESGKVLSSGIYTIKITGPALNLVRKLGIAR